jgi:hypothetical protein
LSGKTTRLRILNANAFCKQSSRGHSCFTDGILQVKASCPPLAAKFIALVGEGVF